MKPSLLEAAAREVLPVDRKPDLTYFSEWANQAEQERSERLSYLLNPNPFSDLWLKRELLESGAVRHFMKKDSRTGEMVENDETKGANNDVYEFDKDALTNLLKKWVQMKYPDVDDVYDVAISRFVEYIADRFVVKIGRTKHFIVKFGIQTRHVPRDMMSAGFDPLGYPIISGPRRIFKLAREVLRANAYIGNEEKHPIVAPDIFGEISGFLDNPFEIVFGVPGKFILRDDRSMETDPVTGLTVSDVAEIDSRKPKFPDYDSYVSFNKRTRKCDIGSVEGDLKPFFDSLVRLGFHDVVQRLSGTDFGKKLLGDAANHGYGRHTTLTYEEAKKIIESLVLKYQEHSFLASEQTTFGYDPRVKSQEWEQIALDNDSAVAFFERDFIRVLRDMPDYIREIFSDKKVLHEFCYMAMEQWNQHPDYKVDQTDTVMSLTMVKFLIKAAYLFYILDSGTPYVPDRNEDFESNEGLSKFLKKFKEGDLQMLLKSTELMLRYHDQCAKQEKRPKFKRFESTYVKVQERLDYNRGDKKIFGPISIAELMTKKQSWLRGYPEIEEQLTVYFYQLYKMYKQTGYIFDQRPHNVAQGVFIFGDWALQTENIQIVIFKDKGGRLYPKVVNIDPEDHFRALPKNSAEKDPREGIATSGLSLADQVGKASIERAMAAVIGGVAEKKGIFGDKETWSPGRIAVQAVLDATRAAASAVQSGVDDASSALVGETTRRTNSTKRRIGSILEFTSAILQS